MAMTTTTGGDKKSNKLNAKKTIHPFTEGWTTVFVFLCIHLEFLFLLKRKDEIIANWETFIAWGIYDNSSVHIERKLN